MRSISLVSERFGADGQALSKRAQLNVTIAGEQWHLCLSLVATLLKQPE